MFRSPQLSRFTAMLIFAFSLASVCCTPALGLPRPHKGAKQQIEAIEQQWRIATLAADVPAMDRLLSDDYVGISWNGQVNTKAMQLDRTRNHTFALSRLDLSDARIKLVGRSVAIVTARAEVAGLSDGSEMKGTFRYTRVYQRLTSGAWKITNFEATRVPDASPIPHHNRNS